MEQFILEIQSIAASGIQTFDIGEGFSLLSQVGGTGKCNLYYI
ncbi:hypothetical protein [Sphingobacterium corticibacterium]|nr:hypothetical protein [Sphingobacterium corticibacterium]